jgi:hypothetical protein
LRDIFFRIYRTLTLASAGCVVAVSDATRFWNMTDLVPLSDPAMLPANHAFVSLGIVLSVLLPGTVTVFDSCGASENVSVACFTVVGAGIARDMGLTAP